MTADEIAELRVWPPKDMASRIARFAQLHWSQHGLLDSALPGCGGQLAAVVGLGMIVSGGLFFLGVPNPAMWGLLAAVLNFVPYFGPVAGIVLLSLVGLLSFETLWQGLLPPAWYLLLHLLEANLITPVVLGRRFTLNPVIIFVSLIFWTWLWGVPGALLSVPILVSVKVVCDRVPRLSSVSELLAN